MQSKMGVIDAISGNVYKSVYIFFIPTITSPIKKNIAIIHFLPTLFPRNHARLAGVNILILSIYLRFIALLIVPLKTFPMYGIIYIKTFVII